jgi:peptidoglycan/xylan/chitin deacetylase (PgdA/CDA1 family)
MIILNFHGVGPVTREVDDGERNCWLERPAFEAFLDLVRGKQNVRLTVDDGNASDFDFILPALIARGLRADFFICSARVDQPTFLTRQQIATMRERGMGIGSHGVAHRPWRSLNDVELEHEVAGSRAELEKVCGCPIDTAACPFGSYSARVLNSLKRAGYRAVYTSDGGGANEHAWLLPRTTITSTTRVEDIRRLIESGPGAVKQASIRAKTLLKRLRP